jgi:membrane-bound ClpP family serine protease
MLTVYWICLLGGLGFTVLALLVGDMLEGLLDAFDSLDGFVDPLSMIGGIAAFGAAGIILSTASGLSEGLTATMAAGTGLALAVVMHFVYVRPMKNSESSSGFSVEEYRGKIGEVLTTIPARGYGEVLIRMGPSNTFQAAASFENVEIAGGTQVVVIDVRDGDLFVAPFADAARALPSEPSAGVPQGPVN